MEYACKICILSRWKFVVNDNVSDRRKDGGGGRPKQYDPVIPSGSMKITSYLLPENSKLYTPHAGDYEMEKKKQLRILLEINQGVV